MYCIFPMCCTSSTHCLPHLHQKSTTILCKYYVLWLHWDLVQNGFHNNYLSVLLGLHFFYLNAMKHVHCDDLVVGCDSSYENQWWNSDGQTSIRLQHCAAVDTISIYELQDTCTQISTKVKNNIACSEWSYYKKKCCKGLLLTEIYVTTYNVHVHVFSKIVSSNVFFDQQRKGLPLLEFCMCGFTGDELLWLSIIWLAVDWIKLVSSLSRISRSSSPSSQASSVSLSYCWNEDFPPPEFLTCLRGVLGMSLLLNKHQ